jgi:hypothetical protein
MGFKSTFKGLIQQMYFYLPDYMTCSSKTVIISYITILHYAQVLSIIKECFNFSFVSRLQNIAIINRIMLRGGADKSLARTGR